ncbi:MAG: DUF5119 domain-containing protein [Muribaculaceae bacterium]|nr:DUF5119 domain-containing protein [Muribaculaceae bacterium]
MKNTKTLLSHIILCGGAILTVSSLTSCCHKDLVYPSTNRGHLNVVFDWRNAPDADPASMELYLYDNDGYNPIRYLFQNNIGGRIRVPSGMYNAICLNGDLTDWAVMSEGETIDGYTISTADAPALSVTGIATAALPSSRAGADETEKERIAATPGMLWGSRLDNIVTPHNDEDMTVTMYPDEKVCHYVVDIYDCGDVADYPASGIDATLSGMAEGYRIGRDTPHENKVTHPIVLTPDIADSSMHSEFLTFGTSATSRQHTLSLYMVRSDGVKWNCNIDVSSQVNDAPDPKHVHIVVRGVNLPEPAPAGTSIKADVDDWVSEYIDLVM